MNAPRCLLFSERPKGSVSLSEGKSVTAVTVVTAKSITSSMRVRTYTWTRHKKQPSQLSQLSQKKVRFWAD